jgi:hypothetical protein
LFCNSRQHLQPISRLDHTWFEMSLTSIPKRAVERWKKKDLFYALLMVYAMKLPIPRRYVIKNIPQVKSSGYCQNLKLHESLFFFF